MKFSINLGTWNSVFAVPTQVVDQHLKLAGGVHLKVLLWLLRHAGTEVDIADISKTLGIGTADIKDAMQYWAAAGLITDFPAIVTILPLHLLRLIRCRLKLLRQKHLSPRKQMLWKSRPIPKSSNIRFPYIH